MISTILIILIILLLDFVSAKFNIYPKTIYTEKLKRNYNAQTIPPFYIKITNKEKENYALLLHEETHWKQYTQTGAIIFYIRYLTQLLVYGYDKMPMELRAREVSNERYDCMYNYTDCVRTGKANTVHNRYFRTKK